MRLIAHVQYMVQLLSQHILFQDKKGFSSCSEAWDHGERCWFYQRETAATSPWQRALLGFTESPNSIASTGRQPPSRQLHGMREGNLPIAGPWDTGLDTRQKRRHSHRPGYSWQKRARYPRSSAGKEDLARKLQSARWSWLGCKVSLMMDCAGNRGL